MGVINPTTFNKLAKEIANIEFQLTPDRINVHISFAVINKSYFWATNAEKSHPFIAENYGGHKTLLHSEYAVLLRCKHISSKSRTLINYRFSRSSSHALLSRPCLSCLKWIVNEFDNAYYTNNLGNLERLY